MSYPCFKDFFAKMDRDGHLPDTVLGGNVGRQAGVGISDDGE